MFLAERISSGIRMTLASSFGIQRMLIAVWRKNTIFNKITQSSEPLSTVAAELEQDESQEESRDELEPIVLPSQSSAAKRPAEESTSQGPAKKPCVYYLPT